MLAETDNQDDSQNGGDEPEAAYLIQEGWGAVWDRVIEQDQLKGKIKLGVDVRKIQRRGLGDYS